MTDDRELLRRYAEGRSEAAFSELAARYVNLVYSAALRRMDGDTHLAQDVTQLVFTDLARKAGSLPPGVVLAGWLHHATRYAAAQMLRTERRRQSREQEAVAMNALDSEQAPDWDQIRPLLDEALDELNPTDRDALLLRYFESKSAREMAQTLGTSEDAAQKRVSRAVERLRELFAKRGVTVGASGLVAVISTNAIQAAPVGLAITISTAAGLAGTAVATTAAATATKAIAMTTLQKTFIVATLAAAVGMGVYEASQFSQLRGQVQSLRQQQAPLTEQIKQLQQERDHIAAKLAALEAENERLNLNTPELLRLRDEVRLLRGAASDSQRVETDAIEVAAKSWLAKVEILKKWIEQRPEQQIPEFQYLRDYDWLDAVKHSNMLGEHAPANAMDGLRESAKRQFAHELSVALRRYVEEHNGYLPAELSQLNPFFFTRPMSEDILRSYKLLHTGKLADLPEREWLVAEIAPPFDQRDDWRMMIRTDDFLRVRR